MALTFGQLFADPLPDGCDECPDLCGADDDCETCDGRGYVCAECSGPCDELGACLQRCEDDE